MKVYSGGPLEVPPITLAQHFHQKAAMHPTRVGYRARPAKGQPYKDHTWREVQTMVEEIGNGLLSAGVNPGDRVALVSETRMEWSLADYGILSAGATLVTVYPTLTDEQVGYLLKDSGATVVFAEDQKQLDKVAKAIDTNPQVKRVITFVETTPPANLAKMTTTLAQFREEGRQYATANAGKLQQRIAAGKPDDVCTLVYTSGTTGVPKGAVLTHRNFVSAVSAAQKVLNVPHDSATLVFLPLAHCYGRLQLQLSVHLNSIIAFGSPATLVDDLKETRPVFLASVPRLYERMYAQIVKKVEEGPDNKKKIFYKAADTAREYGHAISNGGSAGFGLKLKHGLFDKLVYHKLRDALGLTHLKIGITGSAAIRPDLLYFFQGIGVPIYEGYGLTETSAPSNVNLPWKFKPGTVGPPFPGMEQTLADDGEVLMKGPNVFQGYYNLEGETKDAFTADGWFRTGDIGEFDDDGYLRIVDRKKEIEVLNTGKKIAPVTVEEKLKLNPLVADAMLVATDRKFAACLIQPNFDLLVDWANKNNVGYDRSKVVVKPDPTGQPMTYQVGMDLLESPQVRQLYQKIVDETNTRCADFEQIKAFGFADHAFTMDRDELTPTLKKKRRVIMKNYKDRVEKLFA
ncbi:MAG TPA: long-chain fatty acid--CoA ligase [Candidatus Thermoplasmatota archaeon]|nr:long-chain fatty acid--CoA ligase [Candidatus Thermoplasmatota archaeon]